MTSKFKGCATALVIFVASFSPVLGATGKAKGTANPQPIDIIWNPMVNPDPCDLGPALAIYAARADALRGRNMNAHPNRDSHAVAAWVPVNRIWGQLKITAFEEQGEGRNM
jgi:hypothetical protein